MQALDTTIQIDHTGQPSPAAWDRILANLRGRAKEARLEPGDTLEVNLVIKKPTHSNKATRLYFACLGELERHLQAAGKPGDKDGLHLDCKGAFLALVAAECLRETGEEVEYRRRHTLRDGRVVTTLTTTKLSTYAFSLYLGHVDRLAAEYGCDLSEYIDRESPETFRSGRIEETDDLDLVPYDEVGPGLYTVSEETTAYEMQLRAAELW